MKIIRKLGQPPRGLPTKIFAVDPGTTESAYTLLDVRRNKILEFGKVSNNQLMLRVLKTGYKPEHIVCEEICSYGMPVGKTTFDTVRFTGRLEYLCQIEEIPFSLLPRHKVKLALKPLPRKNDKDVRASLISIYGEPGTADSRGKTYGITKDVWAALGVAHAYRKHLIDESRHSPVYTAPSDD